MNEFLQKSVPIAERGEIAGAPVETVDLHHSNAGLVVEGLRPLIPRDVAEREHGISGDILAVLTLPGSDPSVQPKEIAVIDFGEGVDSEHPVPIMTFQGKPVPMMGKATTRYGLNALNYTPEGHMTTYVGIMPGKRIDLGTEPDANKVNYKLGLNGDTETNNALIDPDHATIALANGVLGIADHSEHGLRLTVAGEQRVNPADGGQARLAGSLALLGHEVSRPM